MKTIDPNKKIDLSDAWKKFNIAKDYENSEIVTGLWNIGFRTSGDYPQPRMNWFGTVCGDTLKDAIINARHRALVAEGVAFDWMSPVTKVYYNGRFNLMTMNFEPGDEHKLINVFDEGITNMT